MLAWMSYTENVKKVVELTGRKKTIFYKLLKERGDNIMKYCSRCGRNLKNNENFCPNCGNLAREDRKTKRAMFIFMFVAFLILGFVREIGRDTTTNTNDVVEETTIKINEEYAQIFADRKLKDVSDLEGKTGLEIREYATVDESDVVRKMEFAYNSYDTIVYIVETAYFPISGFNDDEIKTFDNDLKNEIKELEQLDFVDIKYEIGKKYYVLKINYDYLDNTLNLTDLYPLSKINGEYWGDNSGYISARITKDRLRKAGYVLK